MYWADIVPLLQVRYHPGSVIPLTQWCWLNWSMPFRVDLDYKGIVKVYSLFRRELNEKIDTALYAKYETSQKTVSLAWPKDKKLQCQLGDFLPKFSDFSDPLNDYF